MAFSPLYRVIKALVKYVLRIIWLAFFSLHTNNLKKCVTTFELWHSTGNWWSGTYIYLEKSEICWYFFHMVPLDGGRWPNKTRQRSNSWYLVVNDRNMHQDTGKYLSRIKMQFPLMKCVKSLCSEWQMERAGHKSQLVMTYAVIDRNYLTFLYCFFFSHFK